MVSHSSKSFQVFKRCYSNKNYFNDSKQVRKLFFNYFIEQNGHSFVKSSPIIPYCDPSLTFVNAGMNQFKSVFLGHRNPPYTKIANSQKCVRVGGKHNDLDVVGTDGYHHTFFEMLGNWSFGDYFKREACELAWKLLTGPYKLDPSTLYVTYFGGDAALGLEADFETADIWRTIGVRKDHIIPFGTTDNFWEMGLTGPCGPCTEIHVDHTGSSLNRSIEVNTGLSNLTELWNIVFIQFDRDKDGSIKKLSQQFVDTGMGFERLTALLQGKSSNYETDLFLPIFNTIHMANKNIAEYRGKYGIEDVDGIDTAYRIIADHGRMATICLSDGMIPEENYKLRKIIRRAMILRERYFKRENKLLWDVSESVINILGETYPELIKNKQQIKHIMAYEEDVLKSLRSDTSSEWLDVLIKNPKLESIVDTAEISNFILGYKEIIKLQNSDNKFDKISAKLAFKLYDTYGLDRNKITEMAKLFNINVDWRGFDEELKDIRRKTKSNHSLSSNENLFHLRDILQNQNVFPTNDSQKYDYYIDNMDYKFKEIKATLKCIIENGKSLVMKSYDTNCSLIFDKTCFYCEAGGQESDKGTIIFEDGKVFQVNNTQNYQGYIIHNGSFLNTSSIVSVNESVMMKIDPLHRVSIMRNHSATHVLNAAIKQVLKTSTVCQKSSRVTANDLKFDIFVFGKALESKSIINIEQIVRKVIDLNILVNTNIINEDDLLKNDVVLLPGEVYPTNGIRLVEIVKSDFLSREACCGTHVKNTSHLQDFSIISFKQNGRSAYSLKAVTSEKAITVKEKGRQIEELVNKLYQDYKLNNKEPEEIKMEMKNLSKIIADTESRIPYSVQIKCAAVLNNLKNEFKLTDRQNLRELMEMEIKSAVEELTKTEKLWVVHYLRSNAIAPGVPLQKATRVCKHLPVIVLAYSDGAVKARCCVPKNFVTDDFDAEKWMKSTIGTIFSGTVSAPKGQDSLYVCNMKESKVNKDQWDILLQIALDSANKFAESHLGKLHHTVSSNI